MERLEARYHIQTFISMISVLCVLYFPGNVLRKRKSILNMHYLMDDFVFYIGMRWKSPQEGLLFICWWEGRGCEGKESMLDGYVTVRSHTGGCWKPHKRVSTFHIHFRVVEIAIRDGGIIFHASTLGAGVGVRNRVCDRFSVLQMQLSCKYLHILAVAEGR